MLKLILSISGKPGLYKLVSQAKNMLIVESVDKNKKRLPVHSTDRVISLGDIAMYTDDAEVPLAEVLESIKTKQKAEKVALSYKTASNDELADFMAEALPNYDRDRVHFSDIRKLIQWYNLLVEAGELNFVEEADTTEK